MRGEERRDNLHVGKDAFVKDLIAMPNPHDPLERNLGEQPLAAILRERGLSHHDLVAASAVPINHKMITRAERGRRLTLHTQELVLDALNRAAKAAYRREDLFNY